MEMKIIFIVNNACFILIQIHLAINQEHINTDTTSVETTLSDGQNNQKHHYYANDSIMYTLNKSNMDRQQSSYKKIDIHNNCGEHYFRCRNNVCILEHLHCDGLYHCNDLSDELYCPKFSRKKVSLAPIWTLTISSSLKPTKVFMNRNNQWILDRTSTVNSNLNTSIPTNSTLTTSTYNTTKVMQSFSILSSTTMLPNNRRLSASYFFLFY